MTFQTQAKQIALISSMAIVTIVALVLLVSSNTSRHQPQTPISGQKTLSQNGSTKTRNTNNKQQGSNDNQAGGQTGHQSNITVPISAPAKFSSKQSYKIIRKPDGSQSEKQIQINGRQYPVRTYQTMASPDDPLGDQWWVADAKLDLAWDIQRGEHDTLLAIIDTGFGLDHEEFADRWYENPDETGPADSENPSRLNCTDQGLPLTRDCNLIDDDRDGIVDNETGPATYENPSRLNCTDQGLPLTRDCNLIDDGGNGLIDDVSGWDFINFDNSVQAGELNPDGEGTTHGTMVAGVAAATRNNQKGIAGVDSGTKILPIQALNDDEFGDTLSVGLSILYASEQGADVISISLGSALPDEFVRDAIKQATASGSVVVASSGNDGCECMVYPANYPEVLSVGALNTSRQPASFSSWGKNLDILAPGTQITTSTWSKANQTSAYASNVAGTSFSAPMVGGMLTRLLSHQPNATPLQLIAGVTENTDRLDLANSPSHSNNLGFGTLDANQASIRMTTPNNPAQLYSFTPIESGAFLSPESPIEPEGSYVSHHCEDGVATTPMFELTKSSSHFFSISPTENYQAQQDGYNSNFFSYACLEQPHDTPQAIREIDIFSEFRNIFKKH